MWRKTHVGVPPPDVAAALRYTTPHGRWIALRLERRGLPHEIIVDAVREVYGLEPIYWPADA